MIKLTQQERKKIAQAVRKAEGQSPDLDTARALIETMIDDLGRFDDIPYTEISDYAWSFVRFIFPRLAD